MSNSQALNGNIVSVTTVGFITDISNLEEKLMGLNNNNLNLLKVYRSLRKKLTYTKTEFEVVSDERALEVKNVDSVGLASCKTRGQLGITEGGISAATGFQTRFLDKEFL
jgi:hypothetical protein